MLIFSDTDTIEMANGPFYARNDCGVLVDREDAVIEDVADVTVADLLLMPQKIYGESDALFQVK